MRVIVTGSRELTDYNTVAEALDRVFTESPDEPLTVVHGGARGADTLAGHWCKDMIRAGHDVIEEVYAADWSRGKIAGIQRNQEMINLGADYVVAFPRGRSPGTRDCIARAENHMIPVVLG